MLPGYHPDQVHLLGCLRSVQLQRLGGALPSYHPLQRLGGALPSYHPLQRLGGALLTMVPLLGLCLTPTLLPTLIPTLPLARRAAAVGERQRPIPRGATAT